MVVWFIVSTRRRPTFYLADGSDIDISAILWINALGEKGPSALRPTDAIQAISALSDAGVKGYSGKADAKELGKTLKSGKWRYLKIE